MSPQAVDPDGSVLMHWWTGPEPDPAGLDARMPLALDAATHAGRVIVVRTAYLDVWELPGATIDPGGTARGAAARGLSEETGLVTPGLTCLGHLLFALAPDGHRGHGVLSGAELGSADLPERVPDAEITSARWFARGERLRGLDPINGYLAQVGLASTEDGTP